MVSPPGSHTDVDVSVVVVTYNSAAFIGPCLRSIDAHAEWARTSGELESRRAGAAREEVEALLREALVKRLEARIGSDRVSDAVARVAKRELDPYRAIDELLEG